MQDGRSSRVRATKVVWPASQRRMQDLIAGQSTTASFSGVVLCEVMVARIGEMLREARIQWGLSLRDVKDRSQALAKQWGSRSYEVSFSWLHERRVEGTIFQYRNARNGYSEQVSASVNRSPI